MPQDAGKKFCLCVGLMMSLGQTILTSHINTELCLLFYTSKPLFLFLKGWSFLVFNCLWNGTLSFNPLVQSHFPPSLFSHTIELTYSKIEFIKLKTMWVINIMHCLLIPGYSIYFFTVYSTFGPHC